MNDFCILAKVIEFMNTQTHFLSNFSLKGFTSIQIGIYFLLASYLIKTILEGFLIDDNPMGMLSAEILEYVIFGIIFLLFLFSSFALFFSAKRRAKKLQTPFWNSSSKNSFWKYLGSFIIVFIVLFFLKSQGFIDILTPVFLLFYGFILFLLPQKESKNSFIIPVICLLLAIICFLIPSYWYASISILGIAHITYGIVVKN